MAGRIGDRRPFDQGRDIVPSAVGALIVATVVPAAFVEVEPADNRLLAIDHDEFLMVGRGPQARRRRRFPGPGLLLFPFDMAPQAWPRFEAAVLVRLALQALLDNLADTTAQEQAQELPPAPAHFPFMLKDDQLQPATLVLVEGLEL